MRCYSTPLDRPADWSGNYRALEKLVLIGVCPGCTCWKKFRVESVLGIKVNTRLLPLSLSCFPIIIIFICRRFLLFILFDYERIYFEIEMPSLLALPELSSFQHLKNFYFLENILDRKKTFEKEFRFANSFWVYSGRCMRVCIGVRIGSGMGWCMGFICKFFVLAHSKQNIPMFLLYFTLPATRNCLDYYQLIVIVVFCVTKLGLFLCEFYF